MNNDLLNKELIKLAVEVLNPIERDGDWIGDVGAALVTDKGNVYTGICVDVGSGAGFCAERAAIAQMFANKEQKVKKMLPLGITTQKKMSMFCRLVVRADCLCLADLRTT